MPNFMVDSGFCKGRWHTNGEVVYYVHKHAPSRT
jgi:hypothetical protein